MTLATLLSCAKTDQAAYHREIIPWQGYHRHIFGTQQLFSQNKQHAVILLPMVTLQWKKDCANKWFLS